MNNLDWLYTMQPRDLARWFEAEHVEPNDDLSPEKGVSDSDGGSNDANAAQDSREKLEVDLKTLLYEFGGYCFSSREGHTDNVDTFFEDFVFLLDRQAAITEREHPGLTISDDESLINWHGENYLPQSRVLNAERERDEFSLKLKHEMELNRDNRNAFDLERIDELQAKVDELTAERDQWRALCGKMMDAAHEITVLGEGFE